MKDQTLKPFPVVIMTDYGNDIPSFIIQPIQKFKIGDLHALERLLLAHMGKLQNFNHKISKVTIEFFLNDFKFFDCSFQEMNSADFLPPLSSCMTEHSKESDRGNRKKHTVQAEEEG